MEHEVWKDIPGYEGKYQVSNLGRVRSLQLINKNTSKLRKEPKILKLGKDRYLRVTLCGFNSKQTFSVSRLVLTTFNGIAPDKYEAAHLSGDSTDNRLCNLEWVSRAENEHHKQIHGTDLFGERCHNSIFTISDIKKILRMRQQGFKLTEIADRFNSADSTISDICLAKKWAKALAQDDERGKSG